MSDDIPNPVADDAPTPEQFDLPAEVSTLGRSVADVVAVTHDGEIYCLECANPEYVELAKSDPYKIPYGGPVDRGSEWDCPGPSCGHCHRRISDISVIHYSDVCQPDSCEQIDA